MTDSGRAAGAACLDDEALARYIDGGGSAEERRRVEGHLASCADCELLFAEILRVEEDPELAGSLSDDAVAPPQATESRLAPVVPLRRPPRGILMAAGGLLAAAAAIFIVVLPDRDPLAPLVAAVGEERLTAARPTGGFRYGPLRSTLRGGSADDGLTIRAAEAELRQKAASGTPARVHAWGVAQLLAGDTAASVGTLERAAAAAPDVAAYHADLGAARLTQYLESGQEADGIAALDSLDRALALDGTIAEARFNRALLLGALGRTDEARAAWDDYLSRDGNSAWADEARRQREALR